jgi:myxalamid-type polyketide synthase MxaB
MEPIAVIGIGCRVPGAAGPDALWRLLRDGVDAITEVPRDRWDVNRLFDPDQAAPGKMTTRWGGFLDDIDRFDAAFFGIAPREAAFVDPQQRLLLEVSWEAFEDAGLIGDRLAGSDTGVFVGVGTHDYSLLGWGALEGIGPHTGTGTSASIAANRLSYLFDLRGPSITVDTACSASLAAVHLACQSLWNDESGIALAGGVNAILLPVGTIGLSKAGAMAADGRCKSFDARADGYVRSEGAGVVVLKRLSRALVDRDPIYATILGTAINADGRTNGLMAPNRWAQEAVIRDAWRRANVAPGLAHYVEAHGTGTLLGDPIELKALGTVMGEGRPPDRPCTVGSIKSNVGHLEAAAGIAGLIKVALMLKHKAIPPSLHFERPNPHIPFGRLSLRVPSTLEPWPAEGRALAGVSSFGFGGANAHVVLEGSLVVEAPTCEDTPQAQVLPVSARSASALRALVTAHRDALDSATAPALRDICHTAAVRRTHHDYRAAFVGTTSAQLCEHLEQWLERDSSTIGRRGKLAFVFPGQGSQWIGMGRTLWRDEPVFRESIERTAAAFEAFVEWRLERVIDGSAEAPTLDTIDVIQPSLFGIQVALASLWRSWGLEPDAVVGHSMGEVAAAHVAGMLSIEDAARIICRRSALLKRKSGCGAMAMTDLTVASAAAALEPFGSRLSIAACNGPRATVVSGDVAAIEALLTELERRGTFARRILVDVASHSPQMDDLRGELLTELASVHAELPSVPFYSTVTGRRESAPAADAQYWISNLREPVLFAQAVDALRSDGVDAFLEISAHPVLLPALEDLHRDTDSATLLLPSVRREADERTSLLSSLAALYRAGYNVRWTGLFDASARIVPLPRYPWQRERYWLEAGAAQARLTTTSDSRHPFLGPRFDPADQPTASCWPIVSTAASFGYLQDHRVDGAAILPAAGYIEIAQEALAALDGAQRWRLEDLHLERILPLRPNQPRDAQVIVSREGARATVRVLSRATDGSPVHEWTRHASLTARLEASDHTEAAPAADLQRLQARHTSHESGSDFYARLEHLGLSYGPSFRGVIDVWRGDAGALLRVALPEAAGQGTGYQLHPAALDAACFQGVAAALTGEGATDAGALFLPVSVRSFEMRCPQHEIGWAHARAAAGSSHVDERECDVELFGPQGNVVAIARGIRVRRVARNTEPHKPAWANWLYELAWQPSVRSTAPAAGGRWVICMDGTGVGDALVASLGVRGRSVVQLRRGHTYGVEAPGRYRVDPNRQEDVIRALKEATLDGEPCSHVVHLGSLDITDETRDSLALGPIDAVHVVQGVLHCGWRNAPRLWLFTRGAHRVSSSDGTPSPAQMPVWGLGRVIAHEHPELRCTLVDLPSDRVDVEDVLAEISSADRETQIALRRGQRYVGRLVRRAAPPFDPVVSPPFALAITTPGRLDGLRLEPYTRRNPAPDEVEIEVVAAGLNFLDVLGALGVRPDTPTDPAALGYEVSGRVTRVGSDVRTFEQGDEVVALASGGLASFVSAKELFVVRKPAQLEHEAAATLPIAFVTAHYALNEVARLRAGERVLIHAAAGATGLAAIQMARCAGAWIVGTAGSDGKRNYLRSLGVDVVSDSRSDAFVDDVMQATSGYGVDVVLNSLSGRLMEKSIGVLAPYGRFLEIGKRDIYGNAALPLLPFHKSLSYSAIDVAGMAATRPVVLSGLLHTIVAMAERGEIAPLPRQVLPIERAADGFRDMAQGRHVGKIVFTLPPVERGQSSTGKASGETPAYLITGGTGRLGLRAADWLARTRPGTIVLVGRSDPSPAACSDIAALRDRAVNVEVMRADVSREADVHRVMERLCERGLELKGVVHAAGVLDDRLLAGLDADHMRTVMAPKALGAWNLHRATLGRPLDFFVLYSSAAAALGSPGQGNYAAANAFLDGLAHYRHALGLPALAIDWGPFAQEGLAAAANRGGRLALRGIESITPGQGIEVLAALLDSDVVQLCVMPLNLRQWVQFYPKASESPLFDLLVTASPAQSQPTNPSVRARLESAPPSGRRALLEASASVEVAAVIGRDPASISGRTPFSALGFDSLMALEVRNRLESLTGLSLPATLLWTYPDVERLAEHLAGELGISLRDAAARADAVASVDPVDRIRDLSEDEVERLLAVRLGAAKEGR